MVGRPGQTVSIRNTNGTINGTPKLPPSKGIWSECTAADHRDMDTAHTNLTSILADIEAQLTQAAELVLSGGMPEALYASTLRGALVMLPMPLAPRHIVVLGKLKQWKGTELIPAAVCEQLQAAVIAASRPPTEDAGSSGAVAPPVPASAPAKALLLPEWYDGTEEGSWVLLEPEPAE